MLSSQIKGHGSDTQSSEISKMDALDFTLEISSVPAALRDHDSGTGPFKLCADVFI